MHMHSVAHLHDAVLPGNPIGAKPSSHIARTVKSTRVRVFGVLGFVVTITAVGAVFACGGTHRSDAIT